jgi:hypothetical protein
MVPRSQNHHLYFSIPGRAVLNQYQMRKRCPDLFGCICRELWQILASRLRLPSIGPAMLIRFACPSCGDQLAAPDSAAGNTSQCRKCGANFPIPSGTSSHVLSGGNVPTSVGVGPSPFDFGAGPATQKPRMPRRSYWALTWIVLGLLIAAGIGIALLAATKSREAAHALAGLLGIGTCGLVFSAAIGLLVILVLALAPRCPKCERRFTSGHLHNRKDGQRDLRFRYNPVVCRSCGWKSR